MKILVTGATGFIGGAVARKLLHQGHEVVALTRSAAADAAKLRAAGITPVVGDFVNPASLAAPVTEVDAVISLASIGQIEGTPESFAKDRDAVAVARLVKVGQQHGKSNVKTGSLFCLAVT